MKKKIILIILVASLINILVLSDDFVTPGNGTTYTLSDLVYVSNGVVTGAFPEYHLNGNLTVEKTDTLTIENETLVVQEDTAEEPFGYLICIRGKLLANNSRITGFIPETNVSWRGVFFQESDEGSSIKDSIIENGIIGIFCNNSNPEIVGTTVRNCIDSGIYLFANSSPSINNCNFIDNTYANGLMIDGSKPTLLSDNYFDGNGAGVATYGCPENNLVEKNSFYRNNVGIYSSINDYTQFRNNTIFLNEHGVFVTHNSKCTIENNTIELSNITALETFESATPGIFNNVFRQNSYFDELGAVVMNDESRPNLGNTHREGNNIFSNNYGYDLINFTEKYQFAIGNTWSHSAQPDFVIFDDEEDEGDADESGFISGKVIYYATDCRNWQEYK